MSEFKIGDRVARIWDSKTIGTVMDVMITRRLDGLEAYLYQVEFEGVIGTYTGCDFRKESND
jgi:hypothetical protein